MDKEKKSNKKKITNNKIPWKPLIPSIPVLNDKRKTSKTGLRDTMMKP